MDVREILEDLLQRSLTYTVLTYLQAVLKFLNQAKNFADRETISLDSNLNVISMTFQQFNLFESSAEFKYAS